MTANPINCRILYESYTLQQLRDKQKENLDELEALEQVTSTSVDGNSKSFQPRSKYEIQQSIADYECAIQRHIRAGAEPAQAATRRLHFNRPCE